MNNILTETISSPALATIGLLDPVSWIPLILPLAGIALGAVAIISSLYFAHRNRLMKHETIRLALEKGQPIPDSLINESDHAGRVKRPRNDRRSGLILLGVGVGVYLFFDSVGGNGPHWLGAIPALIGVALLINAFFERPTPPSA